MVVVAAVVDANSVHNFFARNSDRHSTRLMGDILKKWTLISFMSTLNELFGLYSAVHNFVILRNALK